MVTAWFYNIQDESDQRALHKYEPNRPVSSEELASIGVLEWKFDPESELEKVYQLMKDRNYASSDQVCCHPCFPIILVSLASPKLSTNWLS
jgi:hypothetical protein